LVPDSLTTAVDHPTVPGAWRTQWAVVADTGRLALRDVFERLGVARLRAGQMCDDVPSRHAPATIASRWSAGTRASVANVPARTRTFAVSAPSTSKASAAISWLQSRLEVR